MNKVNGAETMKINQGMSQGMSLIRPRDEYRIDLPDLSEYSLERSEIIAEILRKKDGVDILIYNWWRHSTPSSQEDGVIAEINGTDAQWSEARALTGDSMYPPVNWVLMDRDCCLAEDLLPDERVGVLVGNDIYLALGRVVGKENTANRISDFFKQRSKEKLRKKGHLEPVEPDTSRIWREYYETLRDLGSTLRRRTYWAALVRHPKLFPLDSKTKARRFSILGLEGKTISLSTIDKRRDINEITYLSPLSKEGRIAALNAMATGFLLATKEDMRKYLIGE